MSNKKLSIAVIGCGIITWRHLDGMSRIDDCEVYALCETVQDGRAEKLKDKYCTPETKIVTDYKDLIGDPNVDAVIITTPDHTHCQITCDFLRDGKPVLLEKPMALKKAECDEMLRVSKETGVMLMVGQVARYSPAFGMMKQMVDAGEIGELTFIESEYAHDYMNRRGEGDWRVHPDREGIIGGGCHAIDLLRWIAGNPIDVRAYSNHKYLTTWPVNDTTIAIYNFPNNVIGKVFCGIGVKRAYTMRTCLYGTRGTLVFESGRKFLELYQCDKDDIHKGFTVPKRIPYTPKGHNMEAEIFDFITALQQGKPAPISPLEGASTVAVACATVEAAAKGKAVKIKYPKY